jgi:hypothetical protein
MRTTLSLTAAACAFLMMLPAAPHAINITPSGSSTLTGNITASSLLVVFRDSTNGLIITCDTHTVRISTRDLSTINNTTARSTATSAVIRRANNTYTSSNPTNRRPPLCDFTANGLAASGTARVDVTCDWILTAADTRNGTVTFPCRRSAGQDNALITLGGSGTFLDGARIRVDEQSGAGTVRSEAAPTRIIWSYTFTLIATCQGCVLFTSLFFNYTETWVIPTAGLS